MDALEDDLTDAQLREWAWFYQLEPWGPEVGFMQSGIVAATIVNTSPNRKRGAPAASPADFMPKFGEPASKVEGIDDAKGLRAELKALSRQVGKKGAGNAGLG